MTDARSERPLWRRLLRPKGLALLALLGLAAAAGWVLSSKGARYGLASLLRGEADYAALEARRAAATAPAEPAPDAPLAIWTEYRGPHGTGVHDEGALELDWGVEGPTCLWRVPVGPAYSSIVVAGGLVLTLEQRREEEALVAFALESGELVWSRTWPGRFYETLSKEGPRSTPAVAGGLVIALGANGRLEAVDLASGEPRWSRDLLAGGEPNLLYGLSASPRIHGELVIVQGASSVLALELASGEERWRALSETLAYSTPQLGELLGRTSVLVEAAERVVGLDADTGAELWSFPWKVANELSCTQPVVVAPDKLLVSAGYGKGSQLVELAAVEGAVEVTLVWKSARLKTRFNEPVLAGRHVYGLDEGTLTCIDPLTGKRTWKRGDYGYGQLLVHEGYLIVVDEDGDVHLLEASPEAHVELAVFDGVEGEANLNVPALAHGRLLLRNERELACFDLRLDAAHGDMAR